MLFAAIMPVRMFVMVSVFLFYFLFIFFKIKKRRGNMVACSREKGVEVKTTENAHVMATGDFKWV